MLFVFIEMFQRLSTDPREKIDFEMRFALTCDAAWVSCPSHLELMNMSRVIQVKVTPQGLTPGAHFTEVSQECHFSEVW